MLAIQNKLFPLSVQRHAFSGFTLVELMVGIVVAAIVSIAILSTHHTTRRTVMTQRQLADIQQQLRGSLYIMERDIRAGGIDITGVGTASAPLGIQDIRRYSIESDPTPSAAPAPNGSPALTINYDLNSDGIIEQSTYLLYDVDSNGIVDLVRDTGGGYQLQAVGIEAIGFAYAIDANPVDGKLDTTATGNIIWAVDSDNDNQLDVHLDAQDDGDIDTDDDLNSDNILADATLPAPVTLDRIRAVRIWLRCRSEQQAKTAVGGSNSRPVVIGDRIIPPANDNVRRRSIVMSIACRNLGI